MEEEVSFSSLEDTVQTCFSWLVVQLPVREKNPTQNLNYIEKTFEREN